MIGSRPGGWSGVVVVSVLICDARRAARDRLYQVMAAVPAVCSIETVHDADELLARFERQPADVVVIGTQRAVPSGVETMRRLSALHPGVAVILFGSADDVASITAAVVGGARAFLRWEVTQPEIFAALADIISHISTFDPRTHPGPGSIDLSERELHVLQGMSHGCSNAAIGAALQLSEDTIKTHARRLYRKLDAADRAQAVAVSMRCGLLT